VPTGLRRQRGIRVPASIAAAGLLLFQIVLGALIFAAIGVVAVLLNLATNFCELHHWAQPWVIQGMGALEMFLWAIDSICFALFVLAEFRNFVTRLWFQKV